MEKATENNGQYTPWWSWEPAAFQPAEPSREQVRIAAAELRERFDWTRGGFAGLTEEQEDGALLFLLEYARRSGDGESLAIAGSILERQGRTGSPLRVCASLEAYAQSGHPGHRSNACAVLDSALRAQRLPGGGFSRAGDGAVELVWNAQMIAALVKAYRVLGESAYLRPAEETRLFLKARLTQTGGRLWQRLWDRVPSGEGQLKDYGFLCWALTELYEANFSVSCLREASALADRMTELFRDPQGGLYDFESDGGGRGIAGLALSRTGRLTGLERHLDAAREQLAWLTGEEEGLALLGLTEELWPCRTLVCTCAGAPPAFLALVGEEYRMMALAKTRGNSRSLEAAAPWLRMFPVPESGTRLYLCRDGLCEAAADDLFQFYQRLSPDRTAEPVANG